MQLADFEAEGSPDFHVAVSYICPKDIYSLLLYLSMLA
ncbi:hypothetical protein THIOKS13330004 [Thiocapsa sp. KS1]|nr:hypothetical protein THIOKS13330004 [Thiocapsa sp. KS1]